MKAVLLGLILTLFACSSKSEAYNIVQFGKTNRQAHKDEAILYTVLYKDTDEFKIMHPDSDSEIKEILYEIGVGDLVELKDFKAFGFKQQVRISILQTKKASLVRKFEKGLDQLAGEEKNKVMKYLFNTEIAFTVEKGVFVHWVNRSGSGKKGQKNSIYRMKMECELIDGTKVYSTDKSNSLFEFNKSMPGQITEGLAIIVEEMEEGDELELLVPSKLSFGEKGIGEGLIPPNSPLLYKLKLIEIIL